MPRALFLSPHLDDVAFSCAEPMLCLARDGWEVIAATVFTASVAAPRGFALACQLDKGLAPEVDYMALRRAEDRACLERLGATSRHVALPEAPHRGYDDVAALFGDVRDDDPAPRDAAGALGALLDALDPDVCAVPLGVGGHVDHRVVVGCVAARMRAEPSRTWLRYAEEPYSTRRPAELEALVGGLPDAVPLRLPSRAGTRRRALDAIEAYATQLPFQFGGARAMRDALGARFARGTPLWREGPPVAALDAVLVRPEPA